MVLESQDRHARRGRDRPGLPGHGYACGACDRAGVCGGSRDPDLPGSADDRRARTCWVEALFVVFFGVVPGDRVAYAISHRSDSADSVADEVEHRGRKAIETDSAAAMIACTFCPRAFGSLRDASSIPQASAPRQSSPPAGRVLASQPVSAPPKPKTRRKQRRATTLWGP